MATNTIYLLWENFRCIGPYQYNVVFVSILMAIFNCMHSFQFLCKILGPMIEFGKKEIVLCYCNKVAWYIDLFKVVSNFVLSVMWV